MSSSAAAVIDLEAFRRQRQERERPGPRSMRPRAPQTVLVPVWVAWIPVWPVA
jgi:hypothetical protein